MTVTFKFLRATSHISVQNECIIILNCQGVQSRSPLLTLALQSWPLQSTFTWQLQYSNTLCRRLMHVASYACHCNDYGEEW